MARTHLCYNEAMNPEAMAPSKETDILSRLEIPLTPEGARDILNIKFSKQDNDRMQHLMEKGNKQTLTPEEQEEVDTYRHLGNLLGIMQARARLLLNDATNTQ